MLPIARFPILHNGMRNVKTFIPVNLTSSKGALLFEEALLFGFQECALATGKISKLFYYPIKRQEKSKKLELELIEKNY